MSDLKTILATEFRDKEYAHAYMHTHLLERLAAQIYQTRTARKMSQTELAEASGIPQAKLSKLECAEVQSFTLATLLKLARALDVALNVSFEPFSKLARSVETATPKSLAVLSRAEDLHGAASLNQLLGAVEARVTATTLSSSAEVTTVNQLPTGADV
jgi:transcriptional regulator with XRE-family HTH domain